VTSIRSAAFKYCDRLTIATVGCSWKTKSLYNFGANVTVNATLHNYENGVCTVCGDKEFPSITFIVDGVVYATIQQKAGETPKLPEPPTKEGYTFKGWANLPEVMPDEDITVEAEFTINTYEITYVIDDVVFAKQSVTYGDKITPPTAPEKEGYTFSGWENLPTTMPAHDVTVKGLYEVNTYLLRIYLNGALYQTMAVDYGTVLDIPVPTVPEDMEFKGWTTEIPETMPAHDLDIYGTYDYPTSIASLQANQRVTIYTLNGLLICKDAQWQTVKDKLAAGMYIVNGKKIFVKTEQ
jgi:uncharacterized repeat protein (TIGR02543 family)